jgi:DNA mismatch endonuclease (patch repair protein)
MDVHTPEQRSFNMSRIRSKDTKPELLVRRLLHHKGYRFRLHRHDLPGSPDVVLPKYNTLIYVHGCFWHRHEGCRFATTPDNNAEKWQRKFQENILRDQKNREEAQRLGWLPIVVWECETRDPELLASRLGTMLRQQATWDE